MRNVVAYLRVSTQEQARSGLGLEAQQSRIEEAAQARKWNIISFEADEGISGSEPWRSRPALVRAVSLIREEKADALVVAKIDRLGRSIPTTVELARDVLASRPGQDPKFLCLDPDLDMATAQGRFMFNMYASVAELEGELIRDRIRAALAAKKARGERLGRPRELPDDVLVTLAELRLSGLGYRDIADRLNDLGFATPRGATSWKHWVVGRVLRSQDGRALLEQGQPFSGG
ncbi:putative resolvase [Paenarthrobacter nicotinovorans]|uniref:recombinase family protein n=1 Tax=Paenarthrobacter nicotinovorans TaxID=29320 RepID=UPI0007CC1F72|nr:recombinase family protein [Paenarthrobacter nicotinovorans]GAT86055.1 putative resolvase [Paenarthrobacter nicotinovorans]